MSPTLITRSAKWVAPTSNDDNTPLTDLAGFHLSVAEAQNGPWRLVASPTENSAQVQVSTSERYFRIVARTTSGAEGVPVVVQVSKPGPVTGAVVE